MSKQSIYNHLRAAGLPRFAVLALQANFTGESDNESCRLQGDFNSDRGPSRDYAQRVDAGLISDLVFATDAKGWGLAQWTYRPRKRALLDFCRYRGASIADEATQCDFVLFELAHDFPDLYAFLLRATPSDFYTAVERICREYENPEVKNIEGFGDYPVTKGVISLQNDRGTSYKAYIAVQNELVKAINEIRDDFCRQNFGRVYNACSEDQQKIAREAIPQNISEAEPKDVTKK